MRSGRVVGAAAALAFAAVGVRQAGAQQVNPGHPQLGVVPGYTQYWVAPDTVVLMPVQEPPFAPQLGLSVIRTAAASAAPLTIQEAANRKDPFVAGILSFIIPGIGSFYAGHSGHGVRHLLIHVGSLVVIVAGVSSATTTGEGGGLGIAAVGYLVLLGNMVWSIFTAVGDANRHNAASTGGGGRVVGSLYVDPQVRVLGSRSTQLLPPGTGSTQRAGLQVLSLRF